MESVVALFERFLAAVIGWSGWIEQLGMPIGMADGLNAMFIAVMLFSIGAWAVDAFWFSRKVRKVDMSLACRLDPDQGKWPYIVLFYPVLHELEETMDTTFA